MVVGRSQLLSSLAGAIADAGFSLLFLIFGGLFGIHNLWYRLAAGRRRKPSSLPSSLPEDTPSEGCFGHVQASDGITLFYRRWSPSGNGQARGRILCIHGAGAHGAHFRIIGDAFAAAGIETYALDLRGHGLSQGERGDLTDMERVVTDIDDTVRHLNTLRPRLPVFLLGESLGALLVMKLALKASTYLSGIVLSGPELEPTESVGASPWSAAAQLLRYAPFLLFHSKARVIDISGREDLVCRDKRQAGKSKIDPLRNNRLSIQTMMAAYRLIRQSYALAGKVLVPTLVLQGGSDLVTNPKAALKLYDKLASQDKQIFFFSDAFHGLFFDPDTPKVLEGLEMWIGQHINAKKDKKRLT